ncbi:MAG TPA: DUF3072 domain-containing protein [Aestuariivirgaceae bacterium]|nr:DUF3072 domain-containing protein [Aestuariivirgaceae bacterium]
MAENPKIDSAPDTNTIKDPEDWVSGHEPMTGARSSYLEDAAGGGARLPGLGE